MLPLMVPETGPVQCSLFNPGNVHSNGVYSISSYARGKDTGGASSCRMCSILEVDAPPIRLLMLPYQVPGLDLFQLAVECPTNKVNNVVI
jgi:hypothetical protein